MKKAKLLFAFSFLLLIFTSVGAMAAGPVPWEIGFQPAASEIKERIEHFHNILLVIITIVTIFVMGLLIYVCVKFRESRNPNPSTRSHNTLLEIIWTGVPILILIGIAVPSFKLLYYTDKTPHAEMTLKVIGYQWYWGYVYPDQGDLAFESRIIPENELKEGQLRLLEVDNRVVLPVDTNIRILTTAADVIHSWAMPAFGVKKDAVPGRVNETWVNIKKPGVYYGQCSELCGAYHGFMPIVVEAVSKQDFAAWVKTAQAKFASSNNQPLNLASSHP